MPRLDKARQRVEALMVDQCVVTLDPQGKRDGTVDPVTLKVIDTPAVVLYGPKGRCLVKQLTDAERTQAGVDENLASLRALLPFGSPAPISGALFSLTRSADAALLGDYTVHSITDLSSFPVVRSLVITRPRPRQPH